MVAKEGPTWITAAIGFPAAVSVGSGISAGLDVLLHTNGSPWIRLTIAFLIVLVVTASALGASKPSGALGWIVAVVLAVLNWLALFAAMLGLPQGIRVLVGG